jgi:hypothetical protein
MLNIIGLSFLSGTAVIAALQSHPRLWEHGADGTSTQFVNAGVTSNRMIVVPLF